MKKRLLLLFCGLFCLLLVLFAFNIPVTVAIQTITDGDSVAPSPDTETVVDTTVASPAEAKAEYVTEVETPVTTAKIEKTPVTNTSATTPAGKLFFYLLLGGTALILIIFFVVYEIKLKKLWVNQKKLW